MHEVAGSSPASTTIQREATRPRVLFYRYDSYRVPGARTRVPSLALIPIPMIGRRAFVASAAALLWPRFSARAQPTGKVYRLGALSPGVRPTAPAPVVSNLLPSALREM